MLQQSNEFGVLDKAEAQVTCSNDTKDLFAKFLRCHRPMSREPCNITEAVEEIREWAVVFAIDISEVLLVFVTRFEVPLQRMRSLISVVIDMTNDIFAMPANVPGRALFRFNRLEEFSKRFI